jgi:hypothetical protein
MSGGKIRSKDKKKKRGIRGEALDFVSPLTEQECIEHLKSSRSNLPNYNLSVYIDGNQFEGEFIVRGYFRPGYATVWFEGRLEPHPAGTLVTGNVVRGYGTSKMGMAVQLVVALVCWILLFIAGVEHINSSTESNGWLLLSGLVLLVVLAVFTVNKRLFDRQATALLMWVTDRLDIQRKGD